MMSLSNKDHHKIGVLTMVKYSGGLMNQLNRITNCLSDMKDQNVLVLVVHGFKPDIFDNNTNSLSTVIDISATNHLLKQAGFPILAEKITSPLPRIETNSWKYLPTLSGEDFHLMKLWKPSANAMRLAESRAPKRPFDTFGLRFGVDEISHYVCGIGGRDYFGLIDSDSDSLHRFESWASSTQGVAALNKHVDEALQCIDNHFDGSKPVYICTAVGKDARHASMEPYVEKIVAARPFLIWDKSAPDHRREVCAMVDVCVGIKAGKHECFPAGSTLNCFINTLRP